MYNTQKLISVICLVSISLNVLAEVTVGAAIIGGQTPYKNYDSAVMPFPVIQYQKNRFYIDNLKTGINLVNSETTKLDAHVNYLPTEFKGSKTSDKKLKKLDKRNSTLLAGIGGTHQFNRQRTAIRANLSADVLGNSNSVMAEVTLDHHFAAGDKFIITPAAGLLLSNKKHNNHYYGVSKKEAIKSGVKQYDADASIHPYIGLTIGYGLTEKISVFASSRIDFLPKEIKDSPMVSRSTIGAVAVGATYTFK